MMQWQIDGLQRHHSGFTIPKDGLIEQMLDQPHRTLLMESETAVGDLAALIAQAEAATAAPPSIRKSS